MNSKEKNVGFLKLINRIFFIIFIKSLFLSKSYNSTNKILIIHLINCFNCNKLKNVKIYQTFL